MSDLAIGPAQTTAPAYSITTTNSSTTDPDAHGLLPAAPSDTNPDDALAGFLILEALSRGAGLETSIKNVNELKKQKQVEWEKQKASLMEAMKAKEDGGFWSKLGKICSTVGKIAAVVASIAVAVGTGGAGAPFVLAVAGACLSSAALAQGELGILQKLGVSDKLAGYIEIGMSVGSVACSFGAGALGGAGAATRFQGAMGTAGRVAAIGSAAATGVQGFAIIKKAGSDGEVEDSYADVAKAKLAETHLEQLLLTVLSELEDSEKEHRNTVSRVNDAIQTRDTTLTLASEMA